MRVGRWARSHITTLTLSHKHDGFAAVCSSPLPLGEGFSYPTRGDFSRRLLEWVAGAVPRASGTSPLK